MFIGILKKKKKTEDEKVFKKVKNKIANQFTKIVHKKKLTFFVKCFLYCQRLFSPKKVSHLTSNCKYTLLSNDDSKEII